LKTGAVSRTCTGIV